MQLRFRRQGFARCILLSFVILVIGSNSAFCQQDSLPEPKPNGLRIGESGGLSKPAKLQENRAQTPGDDFNRREFAQRESFPKIDSILVIGSADTILAGSLESEAQLLPVDCTEEMQLASTLALKIATASMSHASPFFWWMAGPTTNFFPKESNAEELVDDVSQETNKDSVEKSVAIALSEPPRMIRTDELPLAASPVAKSEVNDENDDGEKQPLDEVPRKPTPRNVRIPFDDEPETSKPVAKNPVSSKQTQNRDLDSQRDQEEPHLDPRSGGINDRDQQGIDALSASKPISKRREIRIEDPSNEGIKVAPIVPNKPIDAVLANRLNRTEACLAHYLNNPESTSVRSPWAVMHALLAYGSDYEMIHGQGRVNAIGWMCHNGTCRTQRIFTPNGISFTPNVGGGVQGHEGQFLAILAQSNVPLNYPIQIGSAKFKVEDLVRYEMATCKEKSELTFKLIGLSYYLDSNKQWRANDGKVWSISKLIQEEMAQPIIGAACGGVHRLMGFSFSVRQRQLQGQPISGQYARAAKFVRDYVEYTWQLQNPDGSFSTSWYEGRANEPNDERKVQTSGHMLEWLMYTLSDEEFKNPRVGKAIDFLLTKIYDKREYKWPIGPRGHATRAVALYQGRTKEILSNPSPNAPNQTANKTVPAPIRK